MYTKFYYFKFIQHLQTKKKNYAQKLNYSEEKQLIHTTTDALWNRLILPSEEKLRLISALLSLHILQFIATITNQTHHKFIQKKKINRKKMKRRATIYHFQNPQSISVWPRAQIRNPKRRASSSLSRFSVHRRRRRNMKRTQPERLRRVETA